MRIEITNRLGQALPHWLGGRAAYARNKQEMRIMLGTIQTRRCYLLLVLLVLISFNSANGQTAAFTYQGRLTDGGTAASGPYDLQFKLFDTQTVGTGTPQPPPNGVTVTLTNVNVSAGIFTVQLDFGADAFPGAARFLEISARPSGAGSFTTLAPRQPITSTPYAIRSLNASSADAVTVSGVPGGSGNYVQNTTTPQASANFNISGNGTAGGTLSGNVVNAATQYNIGGSRVLSTAGSSNLFAGVGAGANNTNGLFNSFFGASAGTSNTTGYANAFFGESAGSSNTTGYLNAFFGDSAGSSNTTGSNNTTIGRLADVGSNNLTNATAIGSNARVDASNSLVLGSINGVNFATANTNVGIGTTTPQNTLHVKGGTLIETSGSGGNIQFGTPNQETGMTIIKRDVNNVNQLSRVDMRFDGSVLKLVAINGAGIPDATSGIAIRAAGNVGIGTTAPARLLDVNGRARVDSIPLEASFAPVCFNQAGDLLQCGGSSLRWKTNVRPFLDGLDVVRRLRPINFNWKESGLPDIGLGAEDVAKVAPSLTFVNSKGEAEGVKYDRLNIVLINAVKEQQQQIEQQQKQIATLVTSNAALNARLRGVEKSLRKKAGSARGRR